METVEFDRYIVVAGTTKIAFARNDGVALSTRMATDALRKLHPRTPFSQNDGTVLLLMKHLRVISPHRRSISKTRSPLGINRYLRGPAR